MHVATRTGTWDQGGPELKPKIGIPWPTSSDLAYNRSYFAQYETAVAGAGGEPVSIPLQDSAALKRLASTCDGFVLPGSPADVDSERYGHTRDAASAPPDPAREDCDRTLLEIAESRGTPILGICYGLQSLNVLRGGTLVQDLRPVPVNHSAGAQVAVAHSVMVPSMTLLGGLLSGAESPAHGQFRRLSVNSSHHQAVAIPGQGFTVVARSSEDGVVEALEGQLGKAKVIGVQWHPERSTGLSAASRALFLWLVSAASDVAEGVGEWTHGDSF